MGESVGRGRRKLVAVAAMGSLALGGGLGFRAVESGLIPLPRSVAERDAATSEAWATPSFVALAPLTVTLGPDARARHLRVALQLEVAPGAERAVAEIAPRVNDVLNTFLRAVDERDFELPRAMARLRAQMLRRVQLVAPPGTVHDLLIQEFILN